MNKHYDEGDSVLGKMRLSVKILQSIIALLGGFSYLCIVIYLFLLLSNHVLILPSDSSIIMYIIIETVFLFAVSCIISLLSKLFSKQHVSQIKLLASEPGKHQYHWQGGISILTVGILWLMMAMRSVSILQTCKLIFRKISHADTDFASKRANVSPSFQELYFVIWAVFLIVQISCGFSSPFMIALDCYFIIESITWIMFYTVFRRFFDEKYAIYHVLEHLPLVFALIPLQAIAFASACMTQTSHVSWREIVPVLLGEANENYIIFSFFGLLYSAIVISMIISSFPSENIKPGNPNTIIIGAGDVVKNRLIRAMIQRIERLGESKVGEIHIYTKERIENLRNEWDLKIKSMCIPKTTESIYHLIEKKTIGNNVIAWIETPSDSHLYYLELLLNNADFIAVEKPIVSNRRDLVRLKEFTSSENRKKVFFLSYYLLEKALMLTFLRRPNSFYLKYLDGGVEEFYTKYLELGKIKSITIQLIEASDYRVLPAGGQLIETFIHHCLIASLFSGLPDSWTIQNYTRIETSRQTSIRLSATGELGETIELVLVKGFDSENPTKKQCASLVYDSGTIEADFDNKIAMIKDISGKDIAKTSIREEYKNHYDVQCDMVYECYANSIDPSMIDGLYNQVEVLDWLLDLEFEQFDNAQRELS